MAHRSNTDDHAMMDDAADWAINHWREIRCDGEPCKHGQVACPVAGACHTPDEDQSVSADGEITEFLMRFFVIVGFIAGLIYWGVVR
jgi:hypothetical protein